MRTSGSNGQKTDKAMRAAGLRLIVRHGYEAMTLRQLAAEVGIQAGSLYNYIPSKQRLLFDLVSEHMEQLLREVIIALAGSRNQRDALARFLEFHIRYHMKKKNEVFVINFELRSLTPTNRKKIVALRKRYEGLLTDILTAGQCAGQFQMVDARVTSYALIAMLTGVCTWYKPGGRMSENQIVGLYKNIIFDGLLAENAPPPRKAR